MYFYSWVHTKSLFTHSFVSNPKGQRNLTEGKIYRTDGHHLKVIQE